MNNNAPTDDIGALWDAAVVEYNKTATVKSTLLSYTVDQVLATTVEKEEYFKQWRNDKGKLDIFRSVLKASLGPLNALGQFVSANASAVRNYLHESSVGHVLNFVSGVPSHRNHLYCRFLHDSGANSPFHSAFSTCAHI
jgi:hypothetical protein